MCLGSVRATLSERLAAGRRNAGLSQQALAEAMGPRYDQTMISHLENGRTRLTLDGLVAAARALSVSTDYLLGLTDDQTTRREETHT